MAANILQGIASRLGRRNPANLEQSALEAQFKELLDRATPSVQPAYSLAECEGLAKTDDHCAEFVQKAQENLFEIRELSSISLVPKQLEPSELPLLIAPQPSVASLSWDPLKSTMVTEPTAPCLAVVEAFGAIAETGTVAIASTDCPSSFLFLSEELAVIVRKSVVVPWMEDLWQRFESVPRRALHLISGPSRTADVEQTLQVGAHGPRRVYLYLIDD